MESTEREKHDLVKKEQFLNRSSLLVTKHSKELKNLKKKHAT